MQIPRTTNQRRCRLRLRGLWISVGRDLATQDWQTRPKACMAYLCKGWGVRPSACPGPRTENVQGQPTESSRVHLFRLWGSTNEQRPGPTLIGLPLKMLENGSALRPGSGRIGVEALRCVPYGPTIAGKEMRQGRGDWIGPHSTPFLGQDLPIAAQHAAMARMARGTRVLSAATVCQGSRCLRLDSPPMGCRRWFEVAAGSQPLVWVWCAGKVQVRERIEGVSTPVVCHFIQTAQQPSRHASQCGRWTGQQTGRCRP